MGGSRVISSMRGFDIFIRDCGLREIVLSNAQFSCSRFEGRLVAINVDMFLFTNDREDDFIN